MGLLYGIAALIAIWWLAKSFSGSNPALLAAWLKKLGGGAAMALAAFMVFRGRIDMALLIGGFGAWLLGWAYSHPFSQWTQSWKTSEGKVSKVTSRSLAMELDHDSGTMRGEVLEGRFKGRQLDELTAPELEALMADLQPSDPDAARLLDAYLDRRFAGRSENADADRDPGLNRAGKPGAMTKQEAYDVLGLEQGAGEEAIRHAHRALMKRIHPDAGGTSALAARVNEAKDVLLK